MTTQLYLVPVVRLVNPVYRIPKYLPHPLQAPLAGLEGVPWALDAHLFEDVFILIADTTTAQHNLLTSQSDVLSVANLDGSVSNATTRDVVRNFLEGLLLPAQWVTVGMGYRTIVRAVRGVCMFRNQFVVLLGPSIFNAGLSLDSTVGQMSPRVQQALADAAASLNLDYSGVTGATTIRQLLYGAGSQFAATPIEIRGAGLSLVI